MTSADKAEAILTLSGAPFSTAQAAPRRAAQSNHDPETRRHRLRRPPTRSASSAPAFVDFWGPVAQPSGDSKTAGHGPKFKRLLTDDDTRAKRSTCAAAAPSSSAPAPPATCSTAPAAIIGPDLTGSNRANLDYILTEIINPSEVMQESYQLVTVTTRDGRTLSGNVAAEDDRQLTLRLVGQDTTIAKSEIVSRENSPVSLMPEGLLKTLANDEVRDLLAYLRTTSQVPLPQQ